MAVVAVCCASLAIGQAAITLCGARRWSWLAPAVGLGLVCAISWATVRLPGDGLISALTILLLAIAAALYLHRNLEAGGGTLRTGLPVALGALAAASLPFTVEGHFGILGTGFNPDMSQHLLATDRLAHDNPSQLLHQGYPLGPHAVVVALNKSLGISLVQGFTGLTLATAVLAPLTALAALPTNTPSSRRTATALVVGLTYLVASYYAQGAFKELIQATLVLAFVLALRETTRTWRQLPLRYVPAALIAIGTVYTYSFPGLIWLASIAALYLLAEWIWPKPASPAGGTGPVTGPAGLRAMSLAVLVLAIGALPELGRMLDFKQFETFDPTGPGLGNLFGQISPFEALGIWPSGDFRVAPGDGAAPAFVYYIGAAFATALLILGLRRCRRQGERAILAAIVAVAVVYAAARLGGTPYTSAKALEIAAPLLTLTILLPVSSAGGVGLGGSPAQRRPFFAPKTSSDGDKTQRRKTQQAGDPPNPSTGPAVGSLLYLLAAGLCSLLALANAPVGPTSYSPALTGLRPLLGTSPTLVLAPDTLLDDEHGARYIAWELRGGRVCIEPESAAGATPPPGIRFVVTAGSTERRPFRQLTLRRRAGPYTVWERRGVLGGPSPCPLIAERQIRAAP